MKWYINTRGVFEQNLMPISLEVFKSISPIQTYMNLLNIHIDKFIFLKKNLLKGGANYLHPEQKGQKPIIITISLIYKWTC